MIQRTRQRVIGPRTAAANPFWTRRWVLCSFCAVFIALSLSLMIIRWRVTVEDGFVLSITTSHYAWTYGPVAVLTIIVSLWRQVDYWCKIMQPWQEMRSGYAPAHRSVLLDYLWPLQTTSLYRACQNYHWAVAASTLGHLVLKLMVLISTTLFVLQTRIHDQTVPARINNVFGVGDFWSHVPSALLDDGDSWWGSLFSIYSNVSADPVWSYTRLLNAKANGAQDFANNLAYQNFSVDLDNARSIKQVTAEVELFSPNVTCRTATSTYIINDNQQIDLTLDTPACSLGHRSMTNSSGGLFDQNRSPLGPCDANCHDSTMFINLQRVNCSDQGNPGKEDPSQSTTNRYQYAFIAVNATTRNETDNKGPTRAIEAVEQITAVFCEVKYNMNRASITQSIMDGGNQVLIAPTKGPSSSQLKNLTDLQLSELVFSSLFYAPRPDYSNVKLPTSAIVDSIFSVMATERGNSTSMEPFLDPQTLAHSAKSVLEGLSTRVMLEFFRQPAAIETSATVTYQEQRLYVRSAALWAMVCLSSLAAVLPIIIAITTKRGVAPQQIDTLSSSLDILAQSSLFHTTLQRKGALRGSQMRATLDNMRFTTTESEPFVVKVSVNDTTTTLESKSWLTRCWMVVSGNAKSYWTIGWRQAKRGWLTAWTQAKKILRRSPSSVPKPKVKADWMPYSARKHAVLLTLLLPVFLIFVLEILFQLSRRVRDFVTVSSDSSLEAYAIRYSSTLVLFAVATLYNGLDFTTMTLAPFGVMREGTADTVSSLYYNAAGKLPPVALWINIQHRHAGPAMAILASFIGSILTIIVSGLWVANSLIVAEGPASASMTSAWDLTWKDSSVNDNGAGSLFDHIQHGSAMVPELVQGELVLPSISSVSLADTSLPAVRSANSPLNYSFPVPVLRPRLDCEILPESNVSLTREFKWTAKDYYSNVTAVVRLPDGCYSHGPSDTNPDYVVMTTEHVFYPNRTRVFGELYGLEVDARPGSSSSRCPSLGVLFGQYGSNLDDKEKLLAIVCYQHIEQAQVHVKYTGPLLLPTVDGSQHINLDANSVVNMTNITSGARSFSYKVVNHFSVWTLFEYKSNGFNMFFHHLIYGPNGVSLEKLLESRRTNELCIAMDKLYRRYMVYAIDLNFRTPAMSNNTGTTTRFVSGVVEAYITKLKINKVSKLVLQAMLGAMTVLGGLVYLTAEIRGVLPRSPCSMAGAAALFAGSSVSQRVRDALEAERGADVDAVLRAGPLSLGWWRDQSSVDMNIEEPKDSTIIVSNVTLQNVEAEQVEDGEAGIEVESDGLLTDRKSGLRFGIDMGLPERLGYSNAGGWLKRALRLRRKAKG